MFQFTMQHDTMDCAPTCLKMVAGYYGKNFSLEYLRDLCHLTKNGVSILSISEAAETLGFKTMMVKLSYDKLVSECPLPCILHWNQDHFVVLKAISARKFWSLRRGKENHFEIADPAHGIVKIDRASFEKGFLSTSSDMGLALLLEPTTEFYEKESVKERNTSFNFLFRYLNPYRRNLIQLAFGMIAASLITLILPFASQFLIDEGVGAKNMSVVYVILLAQLFLMLGSVIIEIVRSWLLLHVNTRISLSIISDFLLKLLKLPIKYFDTKAVGDISQRINDHHRIENFLTGSVLTSLFSIFNIVVFTIVLAIYDLKIVLLFLTFSLAGIAWILLFQRKRREMDYKRFSRSRENQDKLYEMINGMQDIKLYGSETSKRWEWERLQVKEYKLNIQNLALEQYQRTGLVFITHIKNILITFFAAREAIYGGFTIGQLLSISYIIGQTTSPLEQLVNFIRAAQDARLSMARLQEIHEKEDEEETTGLFNQEFKDGDILLDNVSFQYEGPSSPFVLRNINLHIPKGKITAIVGTSGSGKTTLMKLLLNFYQPVQGKIFVGEQDLAMLSPKFWRSKCGTVMQDGYIFHDTIARNIALDGKDVDEERMELAVKVANLDSFINGTPSKYTTKIGLSGMGISGGEHQRILIARSVYKDPNYLFFDEATSSLDAKNEKAIMNYLTDYFKSKTVIVIAHRLSTVKMADQIVVLDNGMITEIGTHATLTEKKGKYFDLVHNQLEMAN